MIVLSSLAQYGLLLILISGILTESAEARQRKLSPSQKKAMKQQTSSYKLCRKKTMAKFKSGKLTKKRFEDSLKNCKEKFPAAALYGDCKKSALASFKATPEKLKKAVKSCRKHLVGASFDPNDPIPLYYANERLIFAGIGLNQSLNRNQLSLPNYDCSHLKKVMADPKQGEFFLFGNHPKVFRGFAGDRVKKMAAFKGKKNSELEGYYQPNLGLLTTPSINSSSSIYFPLGQCVYEGELGEHFSGVTIYYLIDAQAKKATPYFGVAFFESDQSTKAIGTKLTKALGQGYRMAGKSRDMTYFSTKKIEEFDSDGDPLNLCATDRRPNLVASVKGGKSTEFLMVANVSGLCEFGDNITTRMTQ